MNWREFLSKTVKPYFQSRMKGKVSFKVLKEHIEEDLRTAKREDVLIPVSLLAIALNSDIFFK